MDLYLIKLGKRDKMISVFEDSVDLTQYLEKVNNAKYLEGVKEEELYNYQDDGLYLLLDDDNDTFIVYKLKRKITPGYVYNSIYTKVKKLNQYKVITD